MYKKERDEAKREEGPEREVSISTDDGAGAKTWLRLTKRGNKEYEVTNQKTCDRKARQKQEKERERDYETPSYFSLTLCPYHCHFLLLFCARGFGSYFSCFLSFFQQDSHRETMSGTWKEYTENLSHLNPREQYLEKKGMLSVSVSSSILWGSTSFSLLLLLSFSSPPDLLFRWGRNVWIVSVWLCLWLHKRSRDSISWWPPFSFVFNFSSSQNFPLVSKVSSR